MSKNKVTKQLFELQRQNLGRILITYYRQGKGPILKNSHGVPLTDENGDIRRGRAFPKGVMVTYQKDDTLYVGHAMCNPEDKYDRYYGLLTAVEKALPANDLLRPMSDKTPDSPPLYFKVLPHSLHHTFEQAMWRTGKAFKLQDLVEKFGVKSEN